MNTDILDLAAAAAYGCIAVAAGTVLPAMFRIARRDGAGSPLPPIARRWAVSTAMVAAVAVAYLVAGLVPEAAWLDRWLVWIGPANAIGLGAYAVYPARSKIAAILLPRRTPPRTDDSRTVGDIETLRRLISPPVTHRQEQDDA